MGRSPEQEEMGGDKEQRIEAGSGCSSPSVLSPPSFLAPLQVRIGSRSSCKFREPHCMHTTASFQETLPLVLWLCHECPDNSGAAWHSPCRLGLPVRGVAVVLGRPDCNHFSKYGNRGSESLRVIPKVTQLISGSLSHLRLLGSGGVQSLSHVRLFVTPWTAAPQASLSITISRSLLKLMFIESVMPSNHLILCCPLLLLPSIFPSIRVFSNELALCIR